jgi:hypothetical protein
MPALTAVSFSYSYPFASAFIQRVQAPGGGPGDTIEVRTNNVSKNYFTVLGIPIRKGRAFTAEEAMAAGEESEPDRHRQVAASGCLRVRSARLTTVLPGGRSAPSRTLVVVGVADDVRTDLVTGEGELSLYEPFARASVFVLRPTVLVKSALPPRAVSEAVRAVAARIDPTVPISGNRPLRALTIDRRLSSQRVFAWVLSLLGGLGFVLAAVGLYGLLAQGVAERTREFGIRMAIGATRRQIYSLVFRQAGLIAAKGGIAGLALAVFGSRLIEAQLWGITARDPSIYATAALAMLGVVFIAAGRPVATHVEPVEVLRIE